MSLLTVTLKIVSPQGKDDTPHNSKGNPWPTTLPTT